MKFKLLSINKYVQIISFF